MKKAIFNNTIIAQSDKTVGASGYLYFPIETVKKEYLTSSDNTSVCPLKGTARYYNIEIDGKISQNAAWYYPTPKDDYKYIKNHIAFWKNVEII